MPAKIVSLLLCLCLMIPASAGAQELPSFETALEGVVRESGCDSLQSFADAYLSGSAGGGAESLAILVGATHPEISFDGYIAAAKAALSDPDSYLSATSKQYMIYTLAFLGEDPASLSPFAEGLAGSLGIMSLIYGIHVADAGVTADGAELRERLLSLRLEDGGWAIFGAVSDVDVTAMALQALAGSADEKTDPAVALLSRRQLEDGGYSGFGDENCESAAQTALALYSLSVDPQSDPRFVKNGCGIFDALRSYNLGDVFSHTAGGGFDRGASAQALCALLCRETGTPFWELRRAEPSPETASASEIATVPSTTAKAADPKAPSYKLIAVLAILGAAILACAVLLIIKKRSPKNFIFILIVAVIAVTAVFVTDIRSVDDFYSVGTVPKEPVGTVSLAISCENLVGKSELITWDGGVILPAEDFALYEGDSVYDVLVRAAREKKLRLDLRGTYVAGIESVYELKFGPLSGWIYHVNGVEAKYGCGEYHPQDGDFIEWLYTLELGRDL